MRADHYFHKGLAENTHRTYSSAQRQYLTFCDRHGFTAVPASEETLSLFVAFLADRLKPQSIKVYLAGVRALHISHGIHNPLTHTIKLHQTLRGIERVHSSPAKQKLPITFDLLCRLKYFIDPHSEDDTVYWAALTTAHFLLLRAGEFTVTSKTSYDIETLLRLQDVNLHTTQTGDEYAALHLRKSKTDQQHRGVVLYVGHAHHTVCAVCALKINLRLQHARPRATPSDPLFRLSSGLPLARRDLTTFLSTLLRLVGLDPHHYSGHSFRIGGATSATIAGLNDYEIKLLGRWSSDCYKRYIRSPLSLFLKVAPRIAQTKDIPYQYASPYHSST